MPAEATARNQKTRTRLIEGTGRALLRHGLRDTTVAQIAQAASLSRRTFYQHFGSKEEACKALYEQVVRDLVRSIRDAVASHEEPIRRLLAGLDAYLDFQQEGGDLVALLQAEAATPDSLLSPLREQTLDQMVSMVDMDVRRTIQVAMDPLVYRSLFLGLEGLVIHLRSSGPFRSPERARVSSVVKRMFVQILAAASEMPQATES